MMTTYQWVTGTVLCCGAGRDRCRERNLKSSEKPTNREPVQVLRTLEHQGYFVMYCETLGRPEQAGGGDGLTDSPRMIDSVGTYELGLI